MYGRLGILAAAAMVFDTMPAYYDYYARRSDNGNTTYKRAKYHRAIQFAAARVVKAACSKKQARRPEPVFQPPMQRKSWRRQCPHNL